MGLIDEVNERKKKRREDEEKSSWLSLSEEVRLRRTVNEDYINSFVSDYDRFMGTVNDGSASYDRALNSVQVLGSKADTISSWLKMNKGRLEQKTYNDLYNSISQMQSGIGSVKDYYSQWDNEDAYNKYAAQQKEYADYKAYDVAAGMAELEKLKKERDTYLAEQEAARQQAMEDETFWDKLGRWLGNTPDTSIPLAGASGYVGGKAPTNKYDSQIAALEAKIEKAKSIQDYEKQLAFYNAFTKNADFATKSAYDSTYRGGEKFNALAGIYTDTGFDDINYDYINRNEMARDRQLLNNIWTNEAFLGLDKSYLSEMTDEEIAIYNYLYDPNDKTASDEYLAFLLSDLTYRQRERRQDQWAAYTDEHPFMASGFSVAMSPLKVLTAIGQIADYTADGSIDQNAGYNKFSDIPTSIRGEVANNIEQSGKWGKVGSWTYQLGMSMGDFLMQTAASGGNSAIASALMGTGAMADTVISAKDRGLSDDQALLLGVVSGAAELVTEKFSLDALFNGDLSKGTLKYILTNAFTEGTEEVSSSLINTLADVIIAKDKSEWQTAINDYLAKNPGASESDAFQKVLGDSMLSLGLDFLGGALMGGTMGAGGAGINYVTNAAPWLQTNKDAVAQYGEVTGDLIQEGLQSDKGSDSYQLAELYKKRTDKGKALSGYQIRSLVEANDAQFAVEDYDAAVSDAKERLTKAGETKNVDKLAKLVIKKVNGEDLTRAEKKALVNSYGSKVAKDIENEYKQTTPYKSITERVGTDGRYGVSETGKTTVRGEEQASNIAEVVTVKDGQMTVKLEDGREVDAGEIDFADDGEALLYSAIADMENMTPAAATALVKAYDPASKQATSDYVNGIDEAYSYGYYGYSVNDLKAGEHAPSLSSKQMMSAYNLGQSARKIGVKSDEARRVKMRTAAEAKVSKKEKVAKQKARFESDAEVYFMDGKNRVKFDERSGDHEYSEQQMAGVNTAKFLSKMGIGSKYVFFESYIKDGKRYFVDANGVEKKAPNGIFTAKDGTIYIDLNAGNKGHGTTLFTMGHELTHFVKAYSEKQFKVLADLVTETFDKTNLSMHERVVAKQDQLSKLRDEHVTYDEAFEEVVADAMSTMLSDGSFHEKLMEIKAKDKGLFNTIKRFFENLIAKFQEIYKQFDPDQREARDIRDMKDMFNKIQDAFAEALVEASENFQASLTPGVEGFVVSENGDPVAYATADGSVQLSIRTYEEEGRTAFRKYLEKCVKSDQLTKAEMTDMLNSIEEIYQVCKEFKDNYAPFSSWSDAAVVRDTHGKPVFSVVTPNGDYKMNLDFSLVCKKRRTLDAVFNEMSKRGIIDDFELGQKSVVKINEIIRKYGLETACALCFVDAKRFRQASMADQFTSLYNELVQSLVPEDQKGNIDHFNFAGYETIKKVDGGIHTWDKSKLDFSHLDYVMKNYASGTVEHKAAKYIKNHPEGRKLLLRGDFMSSKGFDAVKTQNQEMLKLYNSKKGTGGPKAAFGDVQYMNEIIKKAKTWTPAKAYEVGGVRVQSFSDYVPRMVFDYVQMIYDLAATKLPAHAYTKEALFVKQFGLTGIKINMSLIPAIAEGGIAPGLDANGNYVWAGESFDFETAKEIQNAEGYTENCGTICVGVSYQHIVKLLSDPDIRMVIPYHKSGLNPIVAHMNKIAEFTDYTTLLTNPGGCQNTIDKNGSKVEVDFNFNEVLRKTGDPKATVRQYLDWCAKHEYKPRFAEFAWHENYYKLIEDFTLYDKDGKYVPQREVRAVFPKADSAFGSMKDLIKAGLEEDAIVEGKRDSNLSAIVDEIQKTLPKTEAEISEDQVAQADRDLEADEKYSIREEFYEEYDAWDKKDTNKTFVVGTTSDALKAVGMKDQSIILRSGTVLQKVKKHSEISFDTFKGVPELLEHPVIVQFSDAIDAKTKKPKYDSRITVLGELYADGKPVLVSLELLPTNQKKTVVLDFAVVTSAYSKGAIQQYLNENSILYIDPDKKRTDSWLSLNRLQLPLGENRYGPIRKIAYVDGKVKVQNPKSMTAMQKKLFEAGKIDEFGNIRFSERDTAYLDAVNRGDMETAQKMVDEAAKRAGFTSPKLFHGTSKFGFTKFDPAFSDDKMSIFLSSNNLVAETYSGKTENYKVSQRSPITPEGLDKASPETILKLLKENVDYRIEMIGEGETKQIIKKHRSEIKNAIRMAEQLPVLMGDKWNGNAQKDLDKVIASLRNLAEASTYNEFMDAYNDYEGALFDMRWENDTATNLLVELIRDDVQSSYRGLTNYLDTTLYRGNAEYTKRNGKDIFNINEAVSELYKVLFRGVYQLYTNPGNQLVINAEGSNWNQINGKHINASGPVRTRDVAKYAKENGYDSVLIKNLRDSGDYSYMGTSDVHIFFGGDRLKSADPVTYDDSGKVIPLSERFKTENDDIRYSERTDDDVSNRSLLANAFESITQSSAEYKLIQQYKGYIAELNSLEKKLSDFNQQISEIRFGKGKYDAEKLRKLEGEAKKIAKAISDYDKELLWLEASGPLRKVIEQERKKEAQKTKDHVKEIQQNKKNRAEATELRRKIRKAVRDLDKILKHGNKQKNVKEDIQPVVSKALKAADILFTDNYNTYDMLRNGIGTDLSDAEEALVDTCAKMLRDLDKMPTEGYEAWQARQEAEDKLKAKMSKLKEVFARERKRLNNTTVSSILADLADSYKSLETSQQSYVQGAYMEPVYEFLKNLQSEVGGTIVSDMTKDQLESVYAAYQMVLTTVRKANQLFNQGLKMSREQLGNAVIQEVIKAGGTHGLWTKAEIAKNQADWNNTKPIWVANRIGSESFSKLMQGLFQGQYNFAVDIEEAKQFKQEMDKKYNPKSWDAEKQYKFESSTGKEFSLNLQQIMSLYAFSKREQAYSHLLSGGFVFEGNSTVIVDEKGRKKTYIHNGAASYKLNEATLNGIINSLTKEQKAYVDEMQAYLSDVMGAKGNEVSMQLYGIQMFKEKYYFPLRSSGAYMERAKEAEMKKQQGQINLVNSGFTHAVKPQAKTPIILAGFMDVWAEHCNEMSMYHSMVLPMEDFRKVYNYTTVHDENFDSASVYQTIQDAYGKAAVDYIDQLYRELNASATVDPRETPFKTRISKFKKASVMMSASVVVQQFSSIGRAYAIIDPKHFTGKKIDSGTKLTAAEEMKKYAPVAIIKEMGGFDTGTKGSAKSYIMAETYGKGERLQGIKKDKQYRSDIMGYLPAKADEITWCAIWEAAKRETKANHPKMDVTSEEFLKLAGERFSEVVEKTQVYDSVLARSANMRSKSAFMQMATAFMAEPTTTINLLEDAIRSKDKKQLARAFGAVAVSIVLNNALASIVYAMRDDDEDETFIEKYFQSFTSGMIDDLNPMSYYPFLKDVYSLFQGYDVERTDMSVIADVRDALKKTVGLLGKDTSEMDDNELAEHRKGVTSALMSLLDAGCSMFGVPFKNVRRDANGIINAFKTAGKDLTERDTSWLSFWDKVGAAAKDTVPFLAWTKDKPKGDKLYDAIISGDQAHLDRLKGGYKSEDAYHSAVRKALRENDPRIQAAAKARYEGRTDEYKRIFREIQGEGRFGFDDIMSAINTELSKLTPDKETSQYSAKGFVEAVIMGNSNGAQTMRDDIIATHIANGKTRKEAEEAFASSVSSSIREAFSAGVLDANGAKNMLMDYAGKGKDEATSKVNFWTFCEKYPQHKDIFTEERLAKYNEYAKPAKISVDVYARFLSETKDLATVYDKWGDVEKTKREQVLEVIDSLPLTWRQKDALYLAAGYSENNILDVPW